MSLLTRLTTTILSILIFLIPTHLSLHFPQESSYLRGRLSDYLTPSLYLTDIFILLFLFCFYLNPAHRRHLLNFITTHRKNIFRWLPFIFLTLLQIFLHDTPLPTIFYSLKILLFSFFALSYFLYTYSTNRSPLPWPLISLIIFQSLLGLYQFIFQRSLIGYPFLGETTLTLSGSIAQFSLFHHHLIAPYGTTPHPNVLAATLLISLTFLFPFLRAKSISKRLIPILTLLTLIIIFLTQSLAALLIALFLIFTLSSSFRLIRPTRLLLLLLTGLTFIISFALSSDSTSVTRRLSLNSTAFNLLYHSPFLGTGLNQFIPAANSLPNPPLDSATFLQPVHNIYLLLLTETGPLGAITLLYALFPIVKKIHPNTQVEFTRTLPLLTLLLFGLFDHWPLTHQTGLLLFSLVLPHALTPPTISPHQSLKPHHPIRHS